MVFTRLYLAQPYTKVYINSKLKIVLRRKPGGSDLLVRSQPELFMTEIRSCLYYKGIRLKHFYKCSFFLRSESFCYTRELISDSWPRSTACCSPSSSSSSSSSSSQNLSRGRQCRPNGNDSLTSDRRTQKETLIKTLAASSSSSAFFSCMSGQSTLPPELVLAPGGQAQSSLQKKKS